MILRQFVGTFSGRLSYLVGDSLTRNAMLVDPDQEPEMYFKQAERLGLNIGHVFLTVRHSQTEQVSAQLAKSRDVRVYVGRRSGLGFPYIGLHEGDVLEFGHLRLVALETPGVSPEAISILLYDLSTESRLPVGVITGPTLVVGDVGRCGHRDRSLAREYHQSVRKKLMVLPGTTRVYPGLATSCSPDGAVPKCISTTLDAERSTNAALALSSREFVAHVCLENGNG